MFKTIHSFAHPWAGMHTECYTKPGLRLRNGLNSKTFVSSNFYPKSAFPKASLTETGLSQKSNFKIVPKLDPSRSAEPVFQCWNTVATIKTYTSFFSRLWLTCQVQAVMLFVAREPYGTYSIWSQPYMQLKALWQNFTPTSLCLFFVIFLGILLKHDSILCRYIETADSDSVT